MVCIMTGDLQASPGRRRPVRRRRRSSSIRTRVLTIVLIPSAALLITGASVAGSLVSAGLSARNFAGFLQQGVGPFIQFQSAVAAERTLSLRALGGDPQALAGLQAQWGVTNVALSNALRLAAVGQGLNPGTVATMNATVHGLAAQLSAIRKGVQTRQASATEVDLFYDKFINVGASAFLSDALSAPNSAAAVDSITTLDLLSVFDLHSRAIGLGAGWVARGVLSQPDRLVVAQLTGAYQNQLQALVPRLTGSEQADYRRLVTGTAWGLATSEEDDLAQRGKLALPAAEWPVAENTVSADLLGLWGDSFQQAASVAVTAANQTLTRSIALGSLVLVLAVTAFVTALLLANGLVRRLRRLQAKTLEAASETLPSMMRQIGDGDLVDPEAEMTLLEYGSDEIGQVAEAFNNAQRSAVAAAVAEARARGGISKVFLDIAHRSQLVVHRQLELLDIAEAKQSDPEHLELLFQLDHLATRARRNAENLLILGGGQPGRRWRRPVQLEDVVRGAVSETEHFARVSTVRLPDLQVHGSVVGDLIHLLAELVDNATAFSPPDAAVTVRGNVVGKGAVVDVEDQGLGIEFDERERLNQMLAEPPDFQEMALSGQRHLGLFVVGQLAARHGIAVSLLESAYGGTRAIVLIPADVIESVNVAGDDSSARRQSWQRDQPQQILAGLESAPAARPRGRGDAGLRERSAAEPSAEPVLPFPPPQFRASAATLDPQGAASNPMPGRSGRSHAPLPRRERLANLAPGLRLESEVQESRAPRRPPRTPEEAHGSMSAFQRGSRQGRSSRQDN
jgi:methyl-accepting chemotaxis protein